MRAASLFSGIGAPEQARPDWRWLWSAEIEPFASAVLAARHPHSTNLGDVTADDFAERALAIGRPDIVVFGSPCQSFSVAGRRLGLGDARGNLALVALAVVRAVRPHWFVFENVPGLLSSEGGQDFATFLEAVADIGYFGAWRVLDAQYFGLAQRRERLFFVGCAGDWRGPAAVLFERESLQGHPAPSRGEGQGAARPLAAGSPGGSGYRNDADTADSLIANCLNAHGGAGRMDGESETFVTSTLTSNGDAHSGFRDETGLAPVIGGVRRLTPKEAERLQGFPDDYTAVSYRGKPAADGPRYRALGNSMAVPVLRWLLTRIAAAWPIRLDEVA